MTGFTCLGRWFACAFCCLALTAARPSQADPREKDQVWSVDDIHEGQKGYGLTVLKGTERQRFEVLVLGVLKSHSPGRDLVLARVSGIGLEKTGVISGMSGSPVYIDDKLVGAIAYTWSFGKEPLAGITPFIDMREYGKAPKSRAERSGVAVSLLLDQPLPAPTQTEPASVKVAASATGGDRDGFLVPIQTPVTTSGLSPAALEQIAPYLKSAGLVPVQGGATTELTKNKAGQTKLEPGSAMAVGLITGDVSMTAVGTVTEVQGNRVYGFGHPFFSIGACEFPLLTAYIHGVIPRQTVSSKMGSAMDEVGMVDTDVSTCVAGWLGRHAEMLPVNIRVKTDTVERNFNCNIVKEKTLLGPLTLAALGSCTDMQGQAPVDMTAQLNAIVKIKGYPPLEWSDRYSGARYSGQRGLMNVFAPIGNLLSILSTNPFERPVIESVECSVELTDERTSAEIKQARALNPVVQPGETLKVEVDLQPYQPDTKPGETPVIENLVFELPIPDEIKPGTYTLSVADSSTDLVLEIRNRRHLLSPQNFSQLYAFLVEQLSIHNDEVIVRLTAPGMGVALDGVALPDLPAGYVDIFSNEQSQTVTPVLSSIVSRRKTDWVIDGSANVRFEVVKHKEFYH